MGFKKGSKILMKWRSEKDAQEDCERRNDHNIRMCNGVRAYVQERDMRPKGGNLEL